MAAPRRLSYRCQRQPGEEWTYGTGSELGLRFSRAARFWRRLRMRGSRYLLQHAIKHVGLGIGTYIAGGFEKPLVLLAGLGDEEMIGT